MRQTPAQRHRMHSLASQQAEQQNAENAHGQTVGTAYELQLAQLHQHRLCLKDMHSVEKKIEAKGAMLPEYDAYVDGVLKARPGTQDDVIATVMVWHIDAGNYARALEIAEYALESGIKPPDQYNRNLPTIVQDEVAEAILAGKLSGADALQVAAKAMAAAPAATPVPLSATPPAAARAAELARHPRPELLARHAREHERRDQRDGLRHLAGKARPGAEQREHQHGHAQREIEVHLILNESPEFLRWSSSLRCTSTSFSLNFVAPGS